MKNVPEPARWLDAQSDAPEEVRKLLAVGQDAFGPRPGQLEPLGSFVAGLGAAGAGGAGVSGGIHAASHGLGKSALFKLATLVVLGGGAVGGVVTLVQDRHVDARSFVTTAAPVAGNASSTPRSASAPPAVADEPPSLPERAASASEAVAQALEPAPSASAASPPEASRPTMPAHRASAAPVIDAPVSSVSSTPPPTETELALLGRARGLLAAHPADALRAVDEHAARFPHGVFEQEREVLAVEALLKAGRDGEARARAAAFRAAFPGSAYDRRLRVLLGEPTTDK